MTLNELINSGQKVQVVLNASELNDFSKQLLNESREMFNANTHENSEKLLTAAETAAMLHCDRTTLWRWEKAKFLHPVKIGKRLYYRRSDIVNFKKGGNNDRCT